jgi:hypothetical protein
VDEGHRAEARRGAGTRAVRAQALLHQAQEQAQGGALEIGIALQEVAQALRLPARTHCRTARSGKTLSVRWAAVATMRRVLHDGQMPRPLQEKAIRKSCPHSPRRALAKPWARTPHSR